MLFGHHEQDGIVSITSARMHLSRYFLTIFSSYRNRRRLIDHNQFVIVFDYFERETCDWRFVSEWSGMMLYRWTRWVNRSACFTFVSIFDGSLFNVIFPDAIFFSWRSMRTDPLRNTPSNCLWTLSSSHQTVFFQSIFLLQRFQRHNNTVWPSEVLASQSLSSQNLHRCMLLFLRFLIVK